MDELLAVRAPAQREVDGPALRLPSTGPDEIPVGTALAAVLGYARGRRPLLFRPPNEREGRWVQVPAYGWSRFDARPVPTRPLGDDDVLVAEGLHGRLGPADWTAVRAGLDDVRPLVTELLTRAGDRPLHRLPAEELSVLGEPGTVGAALRRLQELPGVLPRHVAAALHHRHPALVPLTDRATRLQLLPHLREGDSGTAAVVHRELVTNDAGFTALEQAARAAGAPATRLRLHDVLLWLSATLRLPHAVALGTAPG